MRVRRDDPPGHHVGPVGEAGRQLEHRRRRAVGPAPGAGGLDHLARAVEQADGTLGEVDRLAPRQRQLAWLGLEHLLVRRARCDDRRVRGRRRRDQRTGQHDQQRQPRDGLEHRNSL
jgi:hypothetical protein